MILKLRHNPVCNYYRSIVLILGVLACISNFYAKSDAGVEDVKDVFEMVAIELVPVPDVDQHAWIPKYYNGDLWFCERNSDSVITKSDGKSYRVVQLENLSKGISESIVFDASQTERMYLTSFHFVKDKLVITDLEYVGICSKGNDYKWTVDTTLPLPYPCIRTTLSGNTLSLLCDITTSHRPSTSRLFRTTFDLATLKYDSLTYYPEPQGFEIMNIQPRSIISQCGDRLLYSEIYTYRIVVTDLSTGKVDTITRNPKEWIQGVPLSKKVIRNHENMAFSDLTSKHNLQSLIQKVSFVGDSCIFVTWTRGKREGEDGTDLSSVYGDVFKLKDNRWTLQDSDIGLSVRAKSLFQLGEQYLQYIYSTDGNYIYEVVKYPGERITATQWATHEEYQRMLESSINNESMRFMVVVRRIK